MYDSYKSGVEYNIARHCLISADLFDSLIHPRLCCGVDLFSVRTRAIMAFEHCSSSANPVMTELVKNAVTPRLTDRPCGHHVLVRTPVEGHSAQSHRQSGLTLPVCSFTLLSLSAKCSLDG